MRNDWKTRALTSSRLEVVAAMLMLMDFPRDWGAMKRQGLGNMQFHGIHLEKSL